MLRLQANGREFVRIVLIRLFIAAILLTLFVDVATADTPTTGTTPPLEAMVIVCRENGFSDDVCDPAPKLAPLIGITEARLANGNMGLLWVTVVGIGFTSALNEERFDLPYKDITAICVDHTPIADIRDVRATTLVPARHYFRITTGDREVVFWVPGGTRKLNDVAVFYHAVLNQILPVTRCDLRPTE